MGGGNGSDALSDVLSGSRRRRKGLGETVGESKVPKYRRGKVPMQLYLRPEVRDGIKLRAALSHKSMAQIIYDLLESEFSKEIAIAAELSEDNQT